jgi:hypothetical protein
VLPGILCIPLGVVTWALAERELARVAAGDTDRAGIRATTWAHRFGIVTMIVGTPFALFAALFLIAR